MEEVQEGGCQSPKSSVEQEYERWGHEMRAS